MRISFDFDGVLCPTPFGRMAVHAPHTHVDPLPDDYAARYAAPSRRGYARLLVECLRFGWRRMAPDAAQVLRDLGADGHELLIVTGRSAQGEPLLRRWLRRNGLSDQVTDVQMAPPGLRPPQHKLAVARMFAVDVHIDDDPRTVFYLAGNGVPRVFLLDHAGALGDTPLPEGVTAVHTLREFVAAIRAIN